MILWNNKLVKRVAEAKWVSVEDHLLLDSLKKAEHKFNQMPLAQIIGVIDKIILKAYFSRY